LAATVAISAKPHELPATHLGLLGEHSLHLPVGYPPGEADLADLKLGPETNSFLNDHDVMYVVAGSPITPPKMSRIRLMSYRATSVGTVGGYPLSAPRMPPA